MGSPAPLLPGGCPRASRRPSPPALLLSALLALGAPAAVEALGPGAGALRAQERPAAAAGPSLEVDSAAGEITLRLGPVDLSSEAARDGPIRTPELDVRLPVEGWLLAYRAALVDDRGEPVPARLLRHVVLRNLERDHLMCPGEGEPVYGTGGESTVWPAVPGVGYPVRRGDRFRVDASFRRAPDAEHREVYLELEVAYRERAPGVERLAAVRPLWLDVRGCDGSSYDLPPGEEVRRAELAAPSDGRLLVVGGHLQPHGRWLRLRDLTTDRVVVRLGARLDREGNVRSMPLVPFLPTGGYRLAEGDSLRVTARYENPTGRRLEDGAMGIVMAYFLADDP